MRFQQKCQLKIDKREQLIISNALNFRLPNNITLLARVGNMKILDAGCYGIQCYWEEVLVQAIYPSKGYRIWTSYMVKYAKEADNEILKLAMIETKELEVR